MEARLKALILTTSYPVNAKSTSGIFVKRLVNSLTPYIDTTVIYPGSNAEDSHTKREIPSRYFIKRWQLLAHQKGGIPAALKHNKLLLALVPLLLVSMLLNTFRKVRSVDVIIANWSISTLIATLPSALFNKKVITILRGEDTNISNSFIKRLMLKLAVALSSKVVLVSSDMQVALLKSFPKAKPKLLVIPNGISEHLLANPLAASSVKNSSERIKLLYVGSLVPRKNVELLLRALVQCGANLKRFKLTIAGDGYLKEQLISFCREHQLSSVVEFLGELSPEDALRVYSNHEVFILPSLSEGRPNVLVEAMAAGCCTLASKIDGVTELIDDGYNGILFSPKNPSDLAEKLKRLLQSPDSIYKLGCNARTFIESSNLSWDNTAKRYLELVNDLTKEKSDS